MIYSYILIRMQPGNTEKAITDMRKIENVETISVVAGDYDIIVRVRDKTLENL